MPSSESIPLIPIKSENANELEKNARNLLPFIQSEPSCAHASFLLTFTLLYFHFVVVIFLDTLASGMVTPILPSLSERFSLLQTWTSSFLALRGATSIILTAPVALVVPIIGVRKLTIIALLGTLISSLLLAFPLSWHFLAVSLIFQGACSEIVWSAGLSLAAQIFGREGKYKEIEKVQEDEAPLQERENGGEMVGTMGLMFTASSLGYLIGPLFGSVLYQYTTTWLPFLMPAIVAFLLLFGVFLYTKEGNVSIRSEDSSTQEKSTFRSRFGLLWKTPVIVFLLLVTLTTSALTGAEEVMLPFYLTKSCKFSLSQVGFLFGIVALAYGAASSFLTEPLTNLIGTKLSMSLGLIGQAVLTPSLFYPGISCSFSFQLIAGVVSGASMAVSSAPVFPIIVEELDRLRAVGSYSMAIAFYNSSYTIGTALGPLLATTLLPFMPSFFIVVGLGFIVALFGPICWWILQKRDPSSSLVSPQQ